MASATPPAEGPSREDEIAVLHHDSTSSSETDSPRIMTPVLFQTIHVDIHENQRWFPILGWGTSRLPEDPPNFTAVVVSEQALTTHASRFASPVAAFHRAFPQHNFARGAAQADARRPPQKLSTETGRHCGGAHGTMTCQPVLPLELHLPPGYVWDGFWELVMHHPHGTDAAGWRYASEFCVPPPPSSHAEAQTNSAGGNTRSSPAAGAGRAHFKRTQTPICVVRYRTWRRRVRAVDGGGPTERRGDEVGYTMTDEDAATERYLRGKQDEMELAERLKRQRLEKLSAGKPWTQEDDLAAEEQLRAFTRTLRARSQQQQQSATRGSHANASFANPFHNSPAEEEQSVAMTDVVGDGTAAGRRPQAMVPLHEPTGATAAAVSFIADDTRNRREEAERDSRAGVPSPEALAESMIEMQLKDSFHGGITGEPPSVEYTSRDTAMSTLDTQAQTSHGNAPPHRTDGLQTEPTVHDFVAASPREAEVPEEARKSPTGVVADAANDFDAIFQKFVNNPEIAKGEPHVATPSSDQDIPHPSSTAVASSTQSGEGAAP